MARVTKSTRRGSRAGGPDGGTRICVLHGSEQMLMRLAFDALRQALRAAHGGVDTIRFDGPAAALRGDNEVKRASPLI